MLDETIHHVGAEPELYTVERNTTKNDVNEQVIKGNIAIIKHTDDGETQIETPEEGAVFEGEQGHLLSGRWRTVSTELIDRITINNLER